MTDTPEPRARQATDANVNAAGWLAQDLDDLDLEAGRGVSAPIGVESGRAEAASTWHSALAGG